MWENNSKKFSLRIVIDYNYDRLVCMWEYSDIFGLKVLKIYLKLKKNRYIK